MTHTKESAKLGIEKNSYSAPPGWVKDAIFYQIFPDRFAKSDTVPKSANLEPWHTAPTQSGYKGGDLMGIVEKLDYLEDLGINAIYLNPIFQSASNHRYHTHDYYQVDPLLGGNIAFKRLIKNAHSRNIRIVLDGVFNHASRGFFQFNDVLENGPASPWIDWFHVKEWPISAYDFTKPANYECWFDLRPLPKLNTDNPEVRSFIMDVAEYWIREYDIDGWRLDVPTEIKSEGFWEEFRQQVRKAKSDAYLVGEIWQEAPDWVNGRRFDAVMNYPFTESTIAFAAGDRVSRSLTQGRDYFPYPALNGQDFSNRLARLLDLYDWNHSCAQLNLLDSHDTPRLLSLVRGDKASLKLATLVQMTYPGAPCIYYGDEIAIRGTNNYDEPHKDPDARWTFPWDDQDSWDNEMRSFFKQAIDIRQRYEALRSGRFIQLGTRELGLVYARTTGQDSVVIGINAADKTCRLKIPHAKWRGLDRSLSISPDMSIILGEGSFDIDNHQDITLTLPARSGMVIS